MARTGRPGPVLVDIPKDVQQTMVVPDWGVPMALSGYMSRLPQPPVEADLAPVIEAIRQVSASLPVLLACHQLGWLLCWLPGLRLKACCAMQAKKPILYIGGGCLDASAEVHLSQSVEALARALGLSYELSQLAVLQPLLLLKALHL